MLIRHALLPILLALPVTLAAQNQPDTNWTTRSEMVPLRDGVKLKTYIVAPKRQSGPLPFLLMRTPYGAVGSTRNFPGAYQFLAQEGYIFVFQDIRGRGESEGKYLMNRPFRTDSTTTDEATDTYDSVDWLIAHVPGNNGRVGGLGISYPGWLATVQAMSGHPAVKAVSPQAPMTDTWMGDDFFHNGAFRMSYGVEYTYGMEVETFNVGVLDMYDWYRRLGVLSNVPRLLGGSWTSWESFVAHPTYDAYWQARATQRHIKATPAAVLTVGGWYDQEDIFGPPATYAAFEQHDSLNHNRIVMGPWNHGGWYGPGADLGQMLFGDSTGVWFRREVEAPFFGFYLKDKGPLNLPEALVFEGGSNQWKRHEAWPPKAAELRNLYFQSNGRLSFDAPTGQSEAYDEYVSDPAHPVPYRPRPIQVTYSRGSLWNSWQAMDQRFVEGRPDVLAWSTEPLTNDVVIAGDLSAELFASTTGTDADWVVKLIDVFPDTVAPRTHMGGYQHMVAGEILRGRYRSSFERAEAITRNRVLDYTIRIPPQAYRFQKGHRIMVQVQSTWFPLYDRNPQTFVPNIFAAKSSDYQQQTHRIWRTARYPSHLVLPVMPQ
jgi:putative CocE/NonD family hydrolase